MKQIVDSTFLGLSFASYLQISTLAFFAITFFQTGIDKVINYKSNKDYFTDHFKNSIISSQVPVLFPVIVALEILSAVLVTVGIAFLLLGNTKVAMLGSILSIVTFLSLYFGQRVAKYYVEASGLVTYIIAAFLSIYFLIL